MIKKNQIIKLNDKIEWWNQIMKLIKNETKKYRNLFKSNTNK